MTTRRFIIAIVICGPAVAALAIYIGLVSDGTITPPDFAAIAQSIGFGATTTAQIAFVSVIAVIGLMAALAPVIYAFRSADSVTVLISLALTGSALAMLFSSRTVMDQISALILYLANLTLSAIVFAAKRISER